MELLEQRVADQIRKLARLRAHADAVEAARKKAGAWSIERYAGSHKKQLEVLRAARTARRILLMMARQAAKSWTIGGAMMDRCLGGKVRCLFLGLTGEAVRENFWVSVWKPLCDQLPPGSVRHNEMRMLTVFVKTGARVSIAGADDTAHIKRYLGNRFAGRSMICIDESQDQKAAVLRELLEDILPPMLTMDTLLLLSGVIPEVPAGPWWEESLKDSWQSFCWGRVRMDDEPQDETSVPWEHAERTVADDGTVTLGEKRTVFLTAVNTHTPEAPQVLVAHMRDNGLDLNDPLIQRDWLGVKTFDTSAQAYRYVVTKNGYRHQQAAWIEEIWDPKLWAKHEIEMPDRKGVVVLAADPMPGIDRFSFALDPAGTSDRLSIEGVGWGKGVRHVQHIFELVTPKAAAWTQGQWAVVASVANRHYGNAQWRYDAPSANEIDTFRRDYKLPVIKCAVKSDRHGQVRRANDLLHRGVLLVIMGSGWEEDMLRAKRDRAAMERGLFEFDSHWHPDPAEAGRYALQGYFEQPADPPPPKKPTTPYEEEQLRIAQRQSMPRRRDTPAVVTRRGF
jgi:hypothetical protein